jgi:aminopeptidase-like protein
MSANKPENCDLARQMISLIKELYPICRSITGDGVRQTLRILQRQLPLTIHEVASGTRVFDWTVPKEWNIRHAFIKNSRGERIVDFAHSNLHVVGYSTPVSGKIPFEDLKKHLHTLPEHPAWIPYRTSYYEETWGFCLPHRQLAQMDDEEYEVCIDSTLEDGALVYGEYYLKGETTNEVLLSCHTCHPSLCNDNLSGIALLTHLANYLSSTVRRYSYRFLFMPGTIGSITWLARNEKNVGSIKHGLVVAGVGDRGEVTYKKSRRGNAEIDRVFSYVLGNAGDGSTVVDFDPYGYDERQFCSPGFNLPVGRISRSPHGKYPEYHTSADNLDFISGTALEDSFAKCVAVLNVLESNKYYVSQTPKCEPQLGKRGLYQALGGGKTHEAQLSMLWVLNLSDGTHDLLDIAEKSRQPFGLVRQAAEVLLKHKLIAEKPLAGGC